MNTDPRTEAAARAIYACYWPTPLENAKAGAFAVARRDAAAALAAADKAATITTVEQIDALLPGSVVLDAKGAVWKRGTGSWVGTGGDGDLEPLPDGARVIHWG